MCIHISYLRSDVDLGDDHGERDLEGAGDGDVLLRHDLCVDGWVLDSSKASDEHNPNPQVVLGNRNPLLG